MPKYHFRPFFGVFLVHFHPTLSNHRNIFLIIKVPVFGLILQSKGGSSISTAYSWRKLNHFKDIMILKLLMLVIPLSLIKSYSDRKLLLHKPLINFKFVGGL